MKMQDTYCYPYECVRISPTRAALKRQFIERPPAPIGACGQCGNDWPSDACTCPETQDKERQRLDAWMADYKAKYAAARAALEGD